MIRFFAAIGRLGPYILAFLAGLFLVINWYDSNFLAPANASATQEVVFEIQPEWNREVISKQLQAKGLISNWWSVNLMSKGKKDEQGNPLPVTAGEYSISPSLTPKEIIDRLWSGETVIHTIQIPAQTTIAAATQLILDTGLVEERAVREAFRNQRLMANLGIPAFMPEGYLIAGSYTFSKPVTADEIVQKMVEEGKATYAKELPELNKRAAELNFRPFEIITLASIIEKESPSREEQKNIASVFHNRLRIGMQIESAEVLRYGIPDLTEQISDIEKKAPGPYNTFTNSGLPPTPICTPSLDAIKAAMYPSETDNLYFVKTPEGSVSYSLTLRDHKKKLTGMMGELGDS